MFVIQTIHAKTIGNRRSMPLRARSKPKELSVAITTQKEWGGYRKQHIFAVSLESLPAPWETLQLLVAFSRLAGETRERKRCTLHDHLRFNIVETKLVYDWEWPIEDALKSVNQHNGAILILRLNLSQ